MGHMGPELVIFNKVVFDDGALQEMVVGRISAKCHPVTIVSSTDCFTTLLGGAWLGTTTSAERLIVATSKVVRSPISSATGGRSSTISLLMWLGQGANHERYRPACQLRTGRIESARP